VIKEFDLFPLHMMFTWSLNNSSGTKKLLVKPTDISYVLIMHVWYLIIYLKFDFVTDIVHEDLVIL